MSSQEQSIALTFSVLLKWTGLLIIKEEGEEGRDDGREGGGERSCDQTSHERRTSILVTLVRLRIRDRLFLPVLLMTASGLRLDFPLCSVMIQSWT